MLALDPSYHPLTPVLANEIEWLRDCVVQRISSIQPGAEFVPFQAPTPPSLEGQTGAYVEFVRKHQLNAHERLTLILALSTSLDPDVLDPFMEEKRLHRHSKVVAVAGGSSLMPTVGTALFLIAGSDVEARTKAARYFDVEHLFYRLSIIDLVSHGKEYLEQQSILMVNASYRDHWITGKTYKPRFSDEFPAHPLHSKLEWEDLMLSPHTQERLEEVKARLKYYDTVVQEHQLAKHAKPGCRVLFYGDSGTGKTLAATLLGQYLDREVYRVDLSAVTSKYIGETSKRLNSLLTTAESKGWILFFDEGDALLGQRQNTEQNANTSQYANQDTAFLLQRMERYDGVIIVATNFKSNIDQAFTRRFEVVVRFDTPDQAMQYQFWLENLPPTLPLANDVNLQGIIQMHPLSPAGIINVIYRVTVLTVAAGETTIPQQRLLTCVRDEELKYKGRRQF